ncbi:hypothetical protein [Streptomyces sp. NPDC008150]|uniref:hypothetical protein n=1 Tax=Streptomyces sp. NPDC008150 TaxID=3364816 RepID=UPI0036E66C27
MNLDDPLDMTRPSWKLYLALLGAGIDDNLAGELMNGYAHELAERQRAALPRVMGCWQGEFHQGVFEAVIAVTDPKLSR